MNEIKVCAIYLAAGASRRMGENKLTLPLGNATIGGLAFQTALESLLEHIVVVTKPNDCLEWMSHLGLQSPYREKWTRISCQKSILGQSYSIGCGIKAALQRNPDAIMILLADQPFLSKGIINQLIYQAEKFFVKKESIGYIAASHQGVPKPPVLFFQPMIPFLMELKGDQGARQLFRKTLFKGILHEINDNASFYDVDTKEDYQTIVTHLRK